MIFGTQTPLVSIAMCVYNGAKFLNAQLESIVNQSYKNIEIIIIDDCSNDQSIEILKDFAAKFSQIRLIQNQTNIGYVKNFEKALAYCNGEFIAFSDQDDIWHRDKISKQINAVSDSILVYHDSQFINEDGTMMDKKMSDVINMVSGKEPKNLLLFNSISGHTCLFSHTLLPFILPFDPAYFHDHWLAYVAANVGAITYIPETLVNYRQHQKSTTDILNKRLIKDDTYHENRDVVKLKRELKWIKKCQSFNFNRNQDFLDAFSALFETRLNTFFSFQYSRFISKHYQALYFIQKKRKGSKQGYIYRQIWGLKSKLFWGKLFN